MRRPALAFVAAKPNRTSDTHRDVAALGRVAAGGAVWVFLAFAASKALGFVTNIVLARLLSPADFGVISFAMIVIGAFTLIQDLGVSYAIVYFGGTEEDLRDLAGTALTINVATALALFLVSVLAAPFVASYAHEPAITTIIPILAISPVLASLGSVQNAVLMQELRFRRKALPDIVPLVASGVVSIVLAVLGFGVWSLVLGYLARNLAATLLLWCLSSIRPWPGLVWTTARRLLGYGQHVSLSGIVGFAALNVDYLVIGHFRGPSDLGIYTLAFTVATLPATAISQFTSSVIFSAFSRLREDRVFMNTMFADVFNTVTILGIVGGLGLFICAPLYLGLLLGPKWAAIREPLEILAVFGVMRSIEPVFPPAFRAAGRPDILWKYNSVRLAMLVPLMLFGIQFGINGVATVQIVVMAVLIPVNIVILSSVIGFPSHRLWFLVLPHAAGAGLAGLIVATARVVPALRVIGTDARGCWALALVALAAYGLVLAVLSPGSVTLARTAVGRTLNIRRRLV